MSASKSVKDEFDALFEMQDDDTPFIKEWKEQLKKNQKEPPPEDQKLHQAMVDAANELALEFKKVVESYDLPCFCHLTDAELEERIRIIEAPERLGC